MKISIVIPTKNEERYLPLLLKSMQDQTYHDKEVIVADAYSSDKTREIAQSFGAKVVDGGMPGPGRNLGANVATGELLVFFDADILLPNPTFLSDCLREFEERILDIATCRVKAMGKNPLDHVMHEAYNIYSVATEQIRPHAPGFCIFARRSAHEAIQGFDEEVLFAEDHDYVQRAQKAGMRFGILRCQKILVSMRRYEKDGRIKTGVKYVFAEGRMIAKGSFKKKMPFTYEFGAFKKNSDRQD